MSSPNINGMTHHVYLGRLTLYVMSSWSVPDDQLRDRMRTEVMEMIRPHYGMFRKTFIKKEFTTKVNKYIKYSEERLDEEIKKIFDREA